MGTELRRRATSLLRFTRQCHSCSSSIPSRPPDEYVPAVAELYTYIIFRASEVKDLAVDEPANQRRDVGEDPAVIGVSLFVARDRK